MNLDIDVRSMLGDIRVPTVVLHAAGDRVVRAGNGRALAQAIPGARLVEEPGDDHAFLFARRKVLNRRGGAAPRRGLPVGRAHLTATAEMAVRTGRKMVRKVKGSACTDANPAAPSRPATSRHSHPSKNQRQGRATMRWSVARAVPSGARTCSTHQNRPPDLEDAPDFAEGRHGVTDAANDQARDDGAHARVRQRQAFGGAFPQVEVDAPAPRGGP